MARLDGKTALVTGAATGIGRAAALLLAQNGARVVLFGLGEAELEAAAAEAGGQAILGDVTQVADIEKAIAACGARLDIVVNAAGLIVPDQPANVSDEVWVKTLDVNLTGTMRVCRAALPLLTQRGGAIVNIASVAAFNASPDSASYAASKAAVVAYTRSLAYAHGADGVRANAVAPGWVRTPMSAYEMRLLAEQNGTTPEAEFQSVERRIALGRMADPAEIAACCLFLASDEASFVTGAVLVADGGGRSPTQNRAV
ncbi:SDR family oxidoreductase [Bradyrhizobium sp. ISRA443]|uniref:SDR family NAD(P)-dependent oxidoreductase n=1 Tax=unclassified Bradyrhizobium TaxID=2631580 RepID=UPI002479D4F8|nr:MULTISPECIES: SDR family oxidoreductase [unclassified Bradyrhizobium]WGR97156.1 SDR family oxidoreductase [Bradyrhizobium sp. ISRA436]WGS04044.1 SDR family oxidoreductase [Bradyrhizobium sp. ISRA437]WGS10927.1 SDR family oxidoreductase [Bradyrhizobium sp. ISRA443]